VASFVILIVARSAENASVDSCHVALMTILVLESTDSDSSIDDLPVYVYSS